MVAPGMFENVVPPSVLSCHCTVGVGLPLAPAVKVTLDAATIWLVGLAVTTGAVLTVSIAAEEVAVLHVFVKTA